MKHAFLLISAVLSLSACAAAISSNKVSSATMTPEELAAREKRTLALTGGRIVRPGTPKGCIRVFDCQSEMAFTNVEAVLKLVGKDLEKFDIGCRQLPDPKGDFAAAKLREKADVAVFVVADDVTPSLLQAPDDGWAAVNVRKLDRNLKSDRAKAKFLVPRYRKQLLRAIILACGGAGSTFPGNAMDVARIEDLDLIKEEFVPYDKFDVCVRYLHDLGLKERQTAIYRRAVREGWAPAPTNDIQKAIWDKAHEVPKAPMKIEFDPKKGK